MLWCSVSVNVSWQHVLSLDSFNVEIKVGSLKFEPSLDQVPAVKSPGKFLALTAGTTVWDPPGEEQWVSHTHTHTHTQSSMSAHLGHPPDCDCARPGSHLVRLVPARYWDGVYQPVHEPILPNVRNLSSLLTGGPSGLPSIRNQTVLSVFFGKYIIHFVALK